MWATIKAFLPTLLNGLGVWLVRTFAKGSYVTPESYDALYDDVNKLVTRANHLNHLNTVRHDAIQGHKDKLYSQINQMTAEQTKCAEQCSHINKLASGLDDILLEQPEK